MNFLEFPGFLVPLLVASAALGASCVAVAAYALAWTVALVLGFALHTRRLIALDKERSRLRSE